MELTTIERERYARQITLAAIGLNGQLKLKEARVVVVGAGGLGSVLLLYLAAAGVGQIVIIDGDKVQLNNLQRQIIFNENDIGYNKAEIAKNKLLALNKNIKVNVIPTYITAENIDSILIANALIADCSDNFKTRYLINDFAVANHCTFVSAAVYKHQMQIGVYNFNFEDQLRSATFRCAFPEENMEDIQDTCAQTGVLGVVPGIAGMLMTNEIIKVITGSKHVQYNKILLLDTQLLEVKQLKIKRNLEHKIQS
jgi:molybdopterin/thiamine biosynthesis adenylyltransferase